MVRLLLIHYNSKTSDAFFCFPHLAFSESISKNSDDFLVLLVLRTSQKPKNCCAALLFLKVL